MANVTFRNILDTESKFEEINDGFLLEVIHRYASMQDQNTMRYILHDKISIYVNREKIEVDDWACIMTDYDDEIIVVPDIHGPAIAIVAGGLLIGAAKLGAVYLGATLASFLMGIGVSLVLGGISQLLFQPDLPVLSSSGSKSTQTYNWNGIQTTARTDQPIPIVYGTHMVGGNIISLFTESYGDNNYLYVLLSLCEGAIEGICTHNNHNSVCQTTDSTDEDYVIPAVWLDDQPFINYTEIEWWYRNGTNIGGSNNEFYPFEQNKIPYFDGSRIQYDDGRELVFGIGPSGDGLIYTTTKEVDRVTIQVYVPILYDASGSKIIEHEVGYRLYWRINGESTFNLIELPVYTPFASNNDVAETSSTDYVRAVSYQPDGDTYLYNIKHPTYVLKIEGTTSYYITYGTYDGVPIKSLQNVLLYSVQDSEGNEIISVNVPDEGAIIDFTEGYNISGALAMDQASDWTTLALKEYNLLINKAVINSPNREYKIQSIDASGTVDAVKITAKTKTGKWSTIDLPLSNAEYGNGKQVFDIKIQRTESLSDDLSITDNMTLNSITEIIDGSFIYPNTALLAMKIKATEQLSGSPPNITVLLKGKKISVPAIQNATPSGSDVLFQDCYWDDDTEKWKKFTGTEVYWNNTASWRTEFSDNAILCVNDLMINPRYGIGNYLETADIYQTTLIENMKDCHILYDPYINLGTYDYTSWWDDANATIWKLNYITTAKPPFVTYNASPTDRTIDYDSGTPADGVYTYVLYMYALVKLNTVLRRNNKIRITLTFSDVTKKLTGVTVYGLSTTKDTTFTSLGTLGAISATGDYYIDCEIPKNIRYVLLKMEGKDIFDFTLSKIQVNNYTYRDHYHTWDGVLDGKQSAPSALMEICDSFRTWISWYDGKFNFIMDKATTPIQTLSYGNTMAFDQAFTPLSEIPHRLIGQFTDEDSSYNMTQMLIQSTNDTLIKSNERTIGLKGITNRKKAERELKFKLNKVTNETHIINVKCGHDLIHCTAGDVINIQDPLPAIGYGNRIIDFNSASNKIIIEDGYNFTSTSTDYIIKYAATDNSSLSATLNITATGTQQTLFVTNWVGSPADYSWFALGEASTAVKPFRIISIQQTEEFDVQFSAIEYHASLYSVEATVLLINDNYSTLSNSLTMPIRPSSVIIAPAPSSSGVGFRIGIVPAKNDNVTTQFIIKMSDEPDFHYDTISVVDRTEKTVFTYINDDLVINQTYYFAVYSRSGLKTNTTPCLGQYTIAPDNYLPSAPTGIYIKGADPNDVDVDGYHYFDGKDIEFVWNTAGVNYTYKIDVYSSAFKGLLTHPYFYTYYSTTPYWNYRFYMNINDNNPSGVPLSKLIFQFKSINKYGLESEKATEFRTANSVPSAPTVTGTAIEDAVKFYFTYGDSDDYLDYSNYTYRYLISHIIDGNMELSGIDYWCDSSDSGAVVKSTTQVYSGTYSLRATHEPSGGSGLKVTNTLTGLYAGTNLLPVTPGDVFYASAMVYPLAVNETHLYVTFLPSDDIQSVPSTTTLIQSCSVSGEWEQLSGTVTVPSGKKWAYCWIGIDDTGSGGYSYIDQMMFGFDWSSWSSLIENNVTINVIGRDKIIQESNKANIHIQVKAVDIYNQSSDVTDYDHEVLNITPYYYVDPISGKGDFQYIQDAVNKVPSGSIIVLKKGIYDLSLEASLDNYASGVYLLDKDVDIIGESLDNTIVKTDNTNSGNKAFRIMYKSNTYKFNNFSIEQVGYTNDAKIVEVKGSGISPSFANITFDRVNFNNKYISYGIYASYMLGGKLIVKNCDFDLNGTVSVFGLQPLYTEYCKNVTFNNNDVNCVTYNGGVKVFEGVNISINYNNINSFGLGAITVDTCTNVVISNNINVADDESSGVGFDYVYGIKVEDTSKLTLIGNVVTINTHPSSPYNNIYGMYLINSDELSLNGNTINITATNFGDYIIYGMRLNSINDGAPISGNTIIINGSTSATQSRYGIYYNNVDNMTVNSNIIDLTASGSNNYGMYLDGSSDDNIISNNQFRNIKSGNEVYEA